MISNTYKLQITIHLFAVVWQLFCMFVSYISVVFLIKRSTTLPSNEWRNAGCVSVRRTARGTNVPPQVRHNNNRAPYTIISKHRTPSKCDRKNVDIKNIHTQNGVYHSCCLLPWINVIYCKHGVMFLNLFVYVNLLEFLY